MSVRSQLQKRIIATCKNVRPWDMEKFVMLLSELVKKPIGHWRCIQIKRAHYHRWNWSRNRNWSAKFIELQKWSSHHPWYSHYDDVPIIRQSQQLEKTSFFKLKLIGAAVVVEMNLHIINKRHSLSKSDRFLALCSSRRIVC